MSITKLICTISLMICLSNLSFAQGTVKGSVTDEDGFPVTDASVTLMPSNEVSYTDSSGNFSFSNVEEGVVTIKTDSYGFSAFSKEVSVTNNETSEVSIMLMVADKVDLKEVVATGLSNPKASVKSSISISSLQQEDVEQTVPRTTAEIFRSIPGIRSESTGGEGNSNITVRGVPVSAGGSRYMLIQEDGLPVLQFGDVAFGTQDQFLRYDNTVNKIEALRGGSASIFASNSPAGIINFISKDGSKEGGSLSTNMGLTYKDYRTDFEYGSPIGKGLSFHVGGFYRYGDGPRQSNYISNNGGQLKFNMTKKFNSGYARLFVKLLDDRAAAYMPMPMKVTGTNDSPTWSDAPNFDATLGALQTPNLLYDRTIGSDNNILETNIADGMHSVTKSIGAELEFDLGNRWTLKDNARVAFNNGQFVAPFPASVGNYNSIIGSVAGYDSAVYAGTTQAVNTSDNFMLIHLFNTTLNNFNNYTNNLTLSKKFKGITANVGLYKSIQNINMTWNWNSYLMEVNDNKARMIDVQNAAGQSLSPNGLLAYGTPAWGNCCNRNYNTTYDITAPFMQVEFEPMDNLNFDVGVRYDMGSVAGSFSGGNGQTASIDMNGNGTIDPNEVAVATISNESTPVDYDYDIFAYSVGANYQFNNNNAVFGRMSKGGTASADRILFSGYEYTNTDDPALDAVKVNTVGQVEVGYKLRNSKYNLNTTFFLANTIESNYEATTQKKFDNTYRSLGVELDGFYKFTDNLQLRGGVTYTQAEITDALDETIVGNKPRRLPDFMYSFVPSYSTEKLSTGVSLIGATKSFSQDSNKLVMNGYMSANPFISYNVLENFRITLNANNIFDSIGVTEVEEGEIVENQDNLVRARSIAGRSVSLNLRFNF